MLQPPRIFTPLQEAPQAPEAPTQLLPTAPAAATNPVEPTAAPAPPALPTPSAATGERGLLARVEARAAARPGRPNHEQAPLKPSQLLAISHSHLPRANTTTKRHASRRGTPSSARTRTFQKLLVTMIVMATIGTLASGTLATFNAQITNASNTFSTGTLALGNTPTGSVQLSASIATSGSLASIPVYRLGAPIASGTSITIWDGVTAGHTQTLTTSANVLPGATSIPTSGGAASYNYNQTTATVSYPLSYSSVTTTAVIASGAALGTLSTTALQSMVPANTALTLSNGVSSQSLTLSASVNAGATSLTVVAGQTAATQYAIGSTIFWSATGTGVATTASITGTVTAIPVNPTAASIPSGTTILLNNPSIAAPNFQSLTTSGVTASGATAITVTSTALNNTYPAGSLVSYNYTSGTTCYSTAVASGTFNNGNANNGCGSLVFTNFGRPQSSSEGAYTADIQITNKGSLPATKLTVYMQNCASVNNPGETYYGTSDLCTKLEMFLQEWTDATHTTVAACWYNTATVANKCDNPMADPSSTLSAFNGSASPLTLTGGIAAGATRYFTIGLRLPTAADNTYQGRTATFDFVWGLQQ